MVLLAKIPLDQFDLEIKLELDGQSGQRLDVVLSLRFLTLASDLLRFSDLPYLAEP